MKIYFIINNFFGDNGGGGGRMTMVASIGEGFKLADGTLDRRGRTMASTVAWRKDDGWHDGMEGGC